MASVVSSSTGYMNDYVLPSEGIGMNSQKDYQPSMAFNRTMDGDQVLAGAYGITYDNPALFDSSAPNVRVLNAEQHYDAELMRQQSKSSDTPHMNTNRSNSGTTYDASMPWKSGAVSEPSMDGRTFGGLIINNSETTPTADDSVRPTKRKKSTESTADQKGQKSSTKKPKPTNAGKKRKLSSSTKAKSSSEDSSGNEKDDDGDKRQRGRPRLETKDETAADRRRTQIRLAQRAYRQRKETIINSLKRRVKEVETAIEDMQTSFLELHDAAMTMQVVESQPQFGKVLKSVTERILAIAKEAGNGALTLDDEDDVKPMPEETKSTKNSKKRGQESSQADDASSTAALTPMSSHSSNISAPDVSGPVEEVYDTNIDWSNDLSFGSLNNSQAPSPGPLVRKTFPNTYTFNHLFLNKDFLPPNLFCEIPETMPNADSYFPPMKESVFAMRLGMKCLQHGYMLLNHPSINQLDFRKAFIYALLFFTKDVVIDHVNSMLRGEPPGTTAFSFPIPNLGGHGLHYVTKRNKNGEIVRVTHGDRASDLSAKTPHGLRSLLARIGYANDAWSIIPFILEAEEKEYLDPEEVEALLFDRGVKLTPYSPTVTVHGNIFGNALVPRSQSPNAFSPIDAFGQQNMVESLSPASFNESDLGINLSSVFPDDMYGSNGLDRNMYSNGFNETKTLNVDLFIRELLKRAVCLGERAGWARSDVETCLMMATC